MRAREADLAEDLRGADEQYAGEKEQFESLISALKEARAKLQLEAEERQGAVEAAERARRADRVKMQLELDTQLGEKEDEMARLKQEMEDARDRVMRGDRELSRTKEALLRAEEGRRIVGATAGMEVEVERLRRECRAAQDEVEDARRAMGKKDAEVAEMVSLPAAHGDQPSCLADVTGGEAERSVGAIVGRKTGEAQDVGQAG